MTIVPQVPRVTPFDLVFDPIADDRFPAIRDALAAKGSDPRDRDAFLMVPETASLIRDLRPDDGVGEGMDQLVALAHHAYLFWAAERPVLPLEQADLEALLEGAPTAGGEAAARYLQFPERQVWAQALEGEAHEPLDGLFVHHTPDGELRVLGVLGVRADRDGFTVVEASGARPTELARPDHSAPFSSILPGGAAAGLHSIAGAPELLELGWRAA